MKILIMSKEDRDQMRIEDFLELQYSMDVLVLYAEGDPRRMEVVKDRFDLMSNLRYGIKYLLEVLVVALDLKKNTDASMADYRRRLNGGSDGPG